LAEINEGDEITSQALIKVITNDLGGLKGIPGGARRVCLLNQADNEQLQAKGHRLASSLRPAYDSVIVTSLSKKRETRHDNINIEATSDANRIFGVHEPVVGIILAAGGSIRMGRPKQLLPWKRETLIHHVTSTVIGAGLDQIIVVVGASEEQVREELIDLPVEIVVNQNWESGQSTSVQAGLSAITENCGSAIFFLADQPGISRTLIRSMIERHAATLAPIVAPIVDGQRGNPVLFDRSTFSDFDSIRGDTGGRELFSRYPVSWIEWHDPAVLSDIDTDDDYQRLISDST
jgi:molybdenum cofactor cytidylyltransferase